MDVERREGRKVETVTDRAREGKPARVPERARQPERCVPLSGIGRTDPLDGADVDGPGRGGVAEYGLYSLTAAHSLACQSRHGG